MTTFTWLVELFTQGGQSMGKYHTGDVSLDNQSRFTSDPLKARRYPKEGAEIVAQRLNDFMKVNTWRAIEHGFIEMPVVTDEMVNRFLAWKLPENFAPDGGITFMPRSNEHMPWGGNKNEPTGTNLLDATQARAMLEHVLGVKK
jgi:hypothetical protein